MARSDLGQRTRIRAGISLAPPEMKGQHVNIRTALQAYLTMIYLISCRVVSKLITCSSTDDSFQLIPSSEITVKIQPLEADSVAFRPNFINDKVLLNCFKF